MILDGDEISNDTDGNDNRKRQHSLLLELLTMSIFDNSIITFFNSKITQNLSIHIDCQLNVLKYEIVIFTSCLFVEYFLVNYRKCPLVFF